MVSPKAQLLWSETKITRQLGKNRGILKPSWAFVKTNILPLPKIIVMAGESMQLGIFMLQLVIRVKGKTYSDERVYEGLSRYFFAIC